MTVSGVVVTLRSARGGASCSSPKANSIPSMPASSRWLSFMSECSSPSRWSLARRGVSLSPRRWRSRSIRSSPSPVEKLWRESEPSSWREKFAPGVVLLSEAAIIPCLSCPSIVRSLRCICPREAEWSLPCTSAWVLGAKMSKPRP